MSSKHQMYSDSHVVCVTSEMVNACCTLYCVLFIWYSGTMVQQTILIQVTTCRYNYEA